MYEIPWRLLFLAWQVGLVDTYTLATIVYNSAAQYGAIVLTAMADGNPSQFPSLLLEPITGFGTSYQFIRAGQTAAERHVRAATLAALFSSSGATVLHSSPTTNAAMGATIAAHYMREVLKTRGGCCILSSEIKNLGLSGLKKCKIILHSSAKSVKSVEINSYRQQFSSQSNLIIQNIFQDHAARRSLSASGVVAPAALASVSGTQISRAALVGWTCVGVSLVSFGIVGSLYLFQRSQRKRWYKNDEAIVIQTDSSLTQF